MQVRPLYCPAYLCRSSRDEGFRRAEYPRDSLGAKAFTAFCTPSVDKLTAAFSCHSSSKAVGSLALEVTWLECSFHGQIALIVSCGALISNRRFASSRGRAILRRYRERINNVMPRTFRGDYKRLWGIAVVLPVARLQLAVSFCFVDNAFVFT